MSTHTLCFWPLTMELLGSCLMSALLLNISWREWSIHSWVLHTRGTTDILDYHQLLWQTSNVCSAIAVDDSLKYQSLIYGIFVWEIHKRYNNNIYYTSCEFPIQNVYRRTTDIIDYLRPLSTPNNIVVYGQKHKVWVLVFLVRTRGTWWDQI